jgi:hypothetical protein
MADSVQRLDAVARDILERAILAGNNPLVIDATSSPTDINAVHLLAGDGWLSPVNTLDAEDKFKFTSPLVRIIAMNKVASLRSPVFPPFLPVTASGTLDVPAVVLESVSNFRAASFLSSLTFSSKTCAVTQERVPNEATYHFELYSVLCLRLCTFCNYGNVFPEADVVDLSAPKRFADIVIVGNDASKHVIELVASASSKSVSEHYDRLIAYMSVHAGSGTCVAFCVSPDLSAFDESKLEWPTPMQRATGLVAVHVVHDAHFCDAIAFTLRPLDVSPIRTALQVSGELRAAN